MTTAVDDELRDEAKRLRRYRDAAIAAIDAAIVRLEKDRKRPMRCKCCAACADTLLDIRAELRPTGR